MSKFNATKKRETTTNYMGHTAYEHTPKVELVNAVLASFIENTYYEKASKRLTRISDLVEEVAAKDPVFVAKLAVFTRDEFNMRSSYHALVGELAKAHRGDNLVAQVLAKAVRPDDLTEIVSYVGKPIPNQVKKGVVKALEKFDEYQLAKYKGDSKEFSLQDLVRMFHPKPGQGRKDLYKALAAGELKNKDTWESRLSGGEKKEVVFKEMLKDRKIGYMATLRNLRNIIQTGDPETIRLAAQFISNPKAVANSRQLPFRFLSAFEAVKGYDRSGGGTIEFEKSADGVDSVVAALNSALAASVQNIPLLTGKTMILSDNSGSMRGDSGGSSAISAYSRHKSSDIANLFAVLYWLRADNTAIGLFGDRLIQPKLDREADIFQNFYNIEQEARKCGPATEQGIFDAFRMLIDHKEKVDRIVIFSDMQIGRNSWYGLGGAARGSFNSLFQEYHKMFPDCLVYSVDLHGYGNTVIGSNVLELAGWSDKIFDVMQLMETDRNALVHKIESVEL